KAIFRCIPNGAMDQVRSSKWPRRRPEEAMNSSRSLTIPRVSRLRVVSIEAQLLQQALEIENVNRMLADTSRPVHVLPSGELNLDPRGQGDMDEKSLARVDIVLGCFHSALRKKEDQTQRYLTALRNPAIQILGHPRGRIYNFRKGLTAEWSQVCNPAAELDKACQIDVYAEPIDLNAQR